jgi:integrase
MERAELLGGHTHTTSNGIRVSIYRREGRYLARGSYQGQRYGVTLGIDEAKAQVELRHLLSKIENGSFQRRTERPPQFFGPPQVHRLTLRELCEACLQEKRKLKGRNTARTYQGRLSHVLDFAELPEPAKRWPLAANIDRTFAIELNTFLLQRQVSRNGRSGGTKRPMSGREVRNVLQTLRMVLAWGTQADVRHLPADFVNPVTPQIVGPEPIKDPLRRAPLPMEERMGILARMDDWQFRTLSILLTLPLRPEDVARALISDLDLPGMNLRLGSHFGGADCSKGRVDITLPLPEELLPVLQLCIGQRPEGPLFQSRRIADGRWRVPRIPRSREELEAWFALELSKCSTAELQAPADQKVVYQRLLRKLGGLTTDDISKELRKLLPVHGSPRPYDLRHAVTQDLHDAGVHHLELRYLTGHTTTDIINEYVGLDPRVEMQKYFERCRPFLRLIEERAKQLETVNRSCA